MCCFYVCDIIYIGTYAYITRRKVKFPCPGNVQYRAEFPVHFLLKYRKFSPILYISWTRKFHIFPAYVYYVINI